MGLNHVKWALTVMVIVVSMHWDRVTAQSGCTTVLLGLAPCLNYITGNITTPASSCCSQLSSVVQSQPQCLCSALNGGSSSLGLGITINQTRALSLPGACNVQTPPVSRCDAAANGPAAPPVSSAESPSAVSSDDTPTTTSIPTPNPSIPSGTGSKSVPTTEVSASNWRKPITHILFTLFIASCIFLLSPYVM